MSDDLLAVEEWLETETYPTSVRMVMIDAGLSRYCHFRVAANASVDAPRIKDSHVLYRKTYSDSGLSVEAEVDLLTIRNWVAF